MQVHCTIQVAESDGAIDLEAAAAKVLKAVGGDAKKDTCTVSLMSMPQSATVGAMAAGPPVQE